MKREMYQKLIEWKNKDKKKPLIIFGARQVGKTYLVEQFAKENYGYFYWISFKIDKNAKVLFSRSLDIN